MSDRRRGQPAPARRRVAQAVRRATFGEHYLALPAGRALIATTGRIDDPALTVVRGLAALWVFVYHAWLSVGPQLLLVGFGVHKLDLTPLASAGWAGVDVFYVLSGFLLWQVFDDWSGGRATLPLARYAKRRALRILPPYYAQVALLALVGAMTTWVEPPSAPALVTQLTLTQSFSYDYFQAVNNVWWTLSIEAQFYVLLPLLAWAIKRVGWTAVVVAGLITMLAWRVGAYHAYANAPIIERVWILEQLPGRIDQFLFGMLASHVARSPNHRAARLRETIQRTVSLRRAMVLFGPIALIALAYLLHVNDFFLRYWAGHPWLYAWHTVSGIAVAASLLALTQRPYGTSSTAVSRSLVAFGTISYSFYLWHEILLRWLGTWLKSSVGEATLGALTLNFALGFPIALVVAYTWYAAFERPFLRARARLR
ncbi:MAG TPA: acyltransferase [Casimicrobiaceae bacterium]|nr:acyltransferase [Casimicrobiaceae bacterium]